MKAIKIAVLSLVLSVAGLALVPATTFALNPLDSICANNSSSEVCQNKGDDAPSLIKTIINTLLFIVGALSVVMIIWGGIRYTTSAGNATSVTSAKNTIIYAVVGVVVSFLAYAIVNWVVNLL